MVRKLGGEGLRLDGDIWENLVYEGKPFERKGIADIVKTPEVPSPPQNET